MSGDTSTSEASLKTRSGAGTSTSTASAKRRKAQVSQLKALQARRAADEAERALESRRRAATAAAAAAEAEAQLVIQEARAEAQRAADAAEIDALELRLMEDDDLKSQSPNDLVFEDRDREGNGAPADPRPPSGVISRHGQMQQLTDVNQIRSQSAAEPQRAHLHEQNANADARERTERWLSELPCGDGQRRTSSLPKITLDEFDGSPLEWPRWSGLFRALVHDNGALSDTKRLTYLQSCLTGEAREAVRGLLCDGNMYEEALKELDMQFGDPRAVVTATLDGVLKHHSIKENDVESLMRFSRALHAAVSVLSARGFEADLAAVTNLDQVLEKLPRSLAWQWGQVELKMAPRRPTLGDVDQWLRPLVLAGRRALSVSRQREVMMPRTQRVAPAEPAGRRRGSSQRTTLATATATEPAPCPACDGEAHNLDCCPVFKAMAPVDRLQLARDNRRCYRCLGESHWASRCRKKLICGENGCRGKHHPLLHVPDHSSRRSEEQDAPALAADQPRSVMATALDATSGPRKALLQVVPVRVLGPAGKFVDTHALLDSGADTSLCIESVLRDLSVTGSTEKLTLGNVEGTGMTRPTMKVSLQVAPLSADGQCEPVKVPEVFSVPQLNIRPQRVDWSKRAQWKHLEGISIPDTNGRKIELLLGANVLEAILQREARVGGPGQPAAIRTYFGWCLTGSVAQLLPVGSREVLHVAHRCEGEEKLQALVRDFWSTEAFGTRYNMKQPRSHEDRLAEEMMESTTKWRGDRYETGLLWKPDCAPLPNDRSMALRRLESTEKALRRAPEKAAAYRDTMREYLDKGYARLLTEEELQKHHQRCWYLPHHAVTSASKPGPMLVKTGGRHEKRYGLLVTCLATRAVHLELCHSLSTDSFLMAFRRFVSRRGRPKEVFSDNGTNLRAGEREMRRQIQAWNVHAISDRLAQDGIKWHFNPPGACHMGGAWERLISSVKRALRAVLSQLTVTDEALQTVLTEVEAVVNGRPLTHVSTEVDDLEAITPNHLLLGRRVTCLPPGVFDNGESASRRIWRQTQALTDQFWTRWLKEYVPSLTCRRKWTRDMRNLAPGDLVLIAEDNVPRGQWPLGRVIEVMPGPDGRVRSARLRARGGTVHRPATKICLLEEAR
ncbi:uncharacterized protein LOC122369009 isoform X2 [Amphibalanus amphitrite]|uniref:uncharacterized protein LOC122369009 isoform X2 n=1 Tax=Amphibalanus amphitrite TaxID=1232801 RepID=UPI001C8FB50D|nr:uncharacterized protein LOC122369009 isoform X2 [Amphibalanus amphitrite]